MRCRSRTSEKSCARICARLLEETTMTTTTATLPDYTTPTAPDCVGRELGTSTWAVVDQARIDQFAACTGDHQWIHVDVERARREGPFGGPIAHGYLTLSLVTAMLIEIGIIPEDAA